MAEQRTTSDPESFREIKLLFGTLDDLSQERRRAYTEWVTARMTPDAFAEVMRENLRRTREAAEALEKLIPRGDAG